MDQTYFSYLEKKDIKKLFKQDEEYTAFSMQSFLNFTSSFVITSRKSNTVMTIH